MNETQGRRASRSPTTDELGSSSPDSRHDSEIAWEIVASAGESDSDRCSQLGMGPVEVPPTPAGSVAVKLLAANRFQILHKLKEPLTLFRLVAVGSRAELNEASLFNLEAAGRRAIAATAIAPCGLPTALSHELTEICKVGGRLIQLSALLRREPIVSHGEFVRLRARAAEAAEHLWDRLERMQAGLPWELEELLACRRQIREKEALGLEASALVNRWLGSERQDAVYAVLGGEERIHATSGPARANELGATEMTKSRARAVLHLGPSESFDEALEAVVREIDALAPITVACVSALDEAPLVRCRDCVEALAVFTRSAPIASRRKRRTRGRVEASGAGDPVAADRDDQPLTA